MISFPPSYLLCSGSLSNIRATPGAPRIPRKQGARGSYKHFCKPWLRGVGVFITHAAKSYDSPSRACRGSACIHILTRTTDQDARSTELCLAFQLWAKGKRDRDSTFDSSPNYSKHQCLGTVQEVAQQRKKNLILIPPSPPPLVLTCHQTGG